MIAKVGGVTEGLSVGAGVAPPVGAGVAPPVGAGVAPPVGATVGLVFVFTTT